MHAVPCCIAQRAAEAALQARFTWAFGGLALGDRDTCKHGPSLHVVAISLSPLIPVLGFSELDAAREERGTGPRQYLLLNERMDE